jgi:uncharacterized protein (DUF1697 family)
LRYVAFLRAVNVGGRKVEMARVRAALTAAGFEGVGSYIASGNVFFDSSERSKDRLVEQLEPLLADEFGFAIPVVLRTLPELEKLLASDPFDGATRSDDQRLVVTFRPGTTSCDVIPVVDGKWQLDTKDTTGTSRFWHTLQKIVAAARP